MLPSPTVPPPRPTDLSATLTRNIAALETRRASEANARSWGERFADRVTEFAGSIPFVALHAAVYSAWIVVNLGWIPWIPAFDKTFVILATEASVEGIFLSTFVLISQNKMTAAADKRANLDLQVNLLAEHEISKIATMLVSVMEHLGLAVDQDHEVADIVRDVAPEAVLDALEQSTGQSA